MLNYPTQSLHIQKKRLVHAISGALLIGSPRTPDLAQTGDISDTIDIKVLEVAGNKYLPQETSLLGFICVLIG